MKKTLLAFLTLILVATASAADLLIFWVDNNPPAMAVSGYNVYKAVGTNAFTLFASTTTNKSVIVSNVTAGSFRFYVAATNIWGEGAPSAVVATPPSVPTNTGLQVWINLQ